MFLPFGGYGFSSTVSVLGKFDLTEKRKHGFVWSVKSSIYSKYLNTDCGLTKKLNVIGFHVLTSDFHTHLVFC